MTKSLLFSMTLFFAGCTIILAQRSSELIYNFPTSPETYQFQKRFSNEVSLYTGQPDISIPIYTIKLDDIEIPITLTYTTGGIRVDEESSVVGLGWSLNYGGEITRILHGAPDERGFVTTLYNDPKGIGTLKTDIPSNSSNYGNLMSNRSYAYRDARNSSDPFVYYQQTTDFRPDEFVFSALGYSGIFSYSQKDQKFISFPIEDTRVTYSLANIHSGTSVKKFDKISIGLPNGYYVQFGDDARRTITKTAYKYDEAWLIKSIGSPKLKTIRFDYITATYNHCSKYVEEKYMFQPAAPQICIKPGSNIECNPAEIPDSTIPPYAHDYTNDDALIQKIFFPNGYVEFTYLQDRQDMVSGAQRLSLVKVFDLKNKLVKKVKLNQDYFQANDNRNLGDCNYDKRLKLNSVEVYGSDDAVPQKYSFVYNIYDKIPSRNSWSQDHWGYFNGKTNTTLMPANEYTSGSGANRSIDTLYSKSFHLKKIIYPEGASKLFKFENHKATVDNIMSLLYKEIEYIEHPIVNIGGAGVSGYELYYYVPQPVQNPYNQYERTVYGPEFDILSTDLNLLGNTNNITMTSTLPFAPTNYQNINAEYNYVEFGLEKFTNGAWVHLSNYGKISKSENSSGFGIRFLPPAGKYRFKIKLVQAYNVGNDVIHNHGSYVGMKIRRPNGVVNNSEVTAGGLRIREIITADNQHAVSYKTAFEYLTDSGQSSGALMNVPSYKQLLTQAYTFSNNDALSYDLSPIARPTRRYGYKFTSDSTIPMNKTKGSNVGYRKVTKIDIGENSNSIKQESYFSMISPMLSDIPERDYLREFEPQKWNRGKLINTKSYNGNDLIQEQLYTYNGENIETDKGYVEELNTDLIDKVMLNGDQCSDYGPLYGIYTGTPMSLLSSYCTPITSLYWIDEIPDIMGQGSAKIPYFKKYSGFDKIASQITKNYFQGNLLQSTEEYFYNSVPQYTPVTTTITSKEDGEKLKRKYYYPQDLPSEPYMNELKSANRVAEVVKTEVFRMAADNSETKIEETKKKYSPSYSYYQLSQGDDPSQYYYITNPLHLSNEEFVKKGVGAITAADRVVSCKRQDFWGNITEYTKENDIPVAILWGYSNTLPVAKLENLSYSSIPISIIRNVRNLSFADIDRCTDPSCTEQVLRNLLNSLRTTFPNAMITTYTYDPLIGMTSTSKPNGDTEYFNYDSFGRLKEVKDHDGNILAANKYNIRP